MRNPPESLLSPQPVLQYNYDDKHCRYSLPTQLNPHSGTRTCTLIESATYSVMKDQTCPRPKRRQPLRSALSASCPRPGSWPFTTLRTSKRAERWFPRCEGPPNSP